MTTPDWLDTLDDEGKTLYNDYVTATKKWVEYIAPKADVKFNTYINTNKKIYNKYELINVMYQQYKLNNETIDCTSSTQSKDLTSKYKKLSLLFHPDKYHNPNNSKLFVFIKQFYNDNNEIIINTINTISHIILDTPNIDNLITNLENPNIDQIIQSYDQSNPHEIFTLLNNSNPIENNCNTLDTTTTTHLDEKYINYVISEKYKFYQQCTTTKKYMDEKYITEEAFITMIKETPYYKQDFIKYCTNLYSHIPNVLSAINEWYKKENERLKKEKTRMEEEINKTTEFINKFKKPTTTDG
jgi:hypothetical protein